MSVQRASRQRMRRRFPRLTLRVDVVLETPEGEVDAVATTLGAGGLFVATDAPLPRGSAITVRFQLPGESERLRFSARVVWAAQGTDDSASPGMGIEFEDAEARGEHAARLEAWAARNREPLRA